uniref:Uncharacterized protein n=1 Tax=Octopus bimaculoides TaxID=37653 RepID=A0A0L8GY26_OCTBM
MNLLVEQLSSNHFHQSIAAIQTKIQKNSVERDKTLSGHEGVAIVKRFEDSGPNPNTRTGVLVFCIDESNIDA